MATIHKLRKDGSTIYPATITDAIVHQDTGATLTEMMISYNVTQLYPTSGLSGGSTYDLSRALTVLSSHLADSEKKIGIHLSFTDSDDIVREYVYQGGTFTSTSGWTQIGDLHSVPDVSGTIEEPDFDPYSDTFHIVSQTLSEAQKAQIITNIGPDTEPIPGSANIITSGGVASNIVFNVSANNGGATFASLSALLNDANLSTLIPDSVRKGGMSIKFILSPDNKYVKYRLMATEFSTTPSDWQGVDDIPTFGSKNLVESGGIVLEGLKNTFKENVDINGLTSLDYQIVSSLKWGTVSSAKHRLIPVNNAKSFLITANSEKPAKYAFLTSDDCASGHDAPLVVGTGLYDIAVGDSELVDIPEGCVYIYLLDTTISSNNPVSGYLPREVKLIIRFPDVASDLLIKKQQTLTSGEKDQVRKNIGIEGIAEASDFNDPTGEQLLKIATVGSIRFGLGFPVHLTEDEYNALTTEQKNNGNWYFIEES